MLCAYISFELFNGTIKFRNISKQKIFLMGISMPISKRCCSDCIILLKESLSLSLNTLNTTNLQYSVFITSELIYRLSAILCEVRNKMEAKIT